jgi:S1-C subfamily serine protease
MNKPEFIKVKGTAMGRPSSGPRLGIRPGNYDAGETRGVEVEGVSVGGPAEKAGLKDGDIIIEIAGRSIQNINTYMQAMALQKQGTKIDIVVLRAKKKMTIKVELD